MYDSACYIFGRICITGTCWEEARCRAFGDASSSQSDGALDLRFPVQSNDSASHQRKFEKKALELALEERGVEEELARKELEEFKDQ